MDQELFNPQSSSVTSSRILYTPSTFARTSLLHLQEIGSLQAIHQHTSTRTNLTSFLCLARGHFPMRNRLISWVRETACSLIVGKHIAIQLRTISGRSNGAISMHHPFRLCMKNTRSVEVCLCSTRRILNRSLHY